MEGTIFQREQVKASTGYSVHQTGRSLRDLPAFSTLKAFSTQRAFSTPAHQQVILTVGQQNVVKN